MNNEELKNFISKVENKIETLFEKIIILEQHDYGFRETVKNNWILLKVVGGLAIICGSGFFALASYTYNNQNQYETERYNARNAVVDKRFDQIFEDLDTIKQKK